MRNFLYKYKLILLFVFSFQSLIFLSFQNCSQNYSLLQFEKNNNSYSGNGSGYGGKLSSEYVHYVPNFSCEGLDSPYSTINLNFDIEPWSATFTQNFLEKCNFSSLNIPMSEIVYSPLQKKVIGYKDSIFEEKNNILLNSINQIPTKMVEIWCTDNWSDSKFEILSSYDSVSLKAETEIININNFKKSNIELINPIRIINSNTVEIQSTQGKLQVFKNLLSTHAGTYQGVWNSTSNYQKYQNLSCRLGGYLDARVWPVKIIPSSPIKLVEKINLRNSLVVLTDLGFLFEYSNNKINEILLPSKTNYPINTFKISSDENYLVFPAAFELDLGVQLYNYNFKLDTFKLLSNKLTSFIQSVDPNFEISKDSSYIIYKDGSQESNSNDVEDWIKRVPIDGSESPTLVANHKIPFSDYGEMPFWVHSESLNKSIYAVGFGSSLEVWFTNQSTKFEKQIDLNFSNLPIGCQNLKLTNSSAFRGDFFISLDQFVFMIFSCETLNNTTMQPQSYLAIYDLKSENFIFKNEFGGYGLTPTDDKEIYLVTTGTIIQNQKLTPLYFDLKKMDFIYSSDLNIKSRINNVYSFSNTVKYILADKLYSLSMTNKLKSICDLNSNLPIKGINKIPGFDELIIAKESEDNINIYIYKENQPSCDLIHTLPKSNFNFKNLISIRSEKIQLSTINSIYLLNLQFYVDPFFSQNSQTETNNDHLILISTNPSKGVIEITQNPLNKGFAIYNFGFIQKEAGVIEVYYLSNNLDYPQISVWDIPLEFVK